MNGPASTLKLEEIMITNVHRVHMDMKIREVVELLVRHRISGAPIVDSMDQVVSMIGEGDCLRLAAKEGLEATISHCLVQLPAAKDLVSLKKENTFTEAYRIFLKHKIHRLAIVDSNGRLKGLVTRSDILKLFVESYYGKKIIRQPA